MTNRFTPARLRSFGLFGITVVLNGSISILAIPVIVALAGAGPWASMATGQSIGGFFAVVAEFGWGLTAPAAIAAAAPHLRPAMFLDSLLARLLLVLPLAILQAAVTIAIVPQAKVVAIVSGAAVLLTGVSASWYFAGEARPGRFLFLDTVPRVAGTLFGLLLVALTDDLLLFAVAQLGGSLVALVASAYVILREGRFDLRTAARWPRIRSNLAAQRHGLLATGLNAAFVPAVLAIVAVGSPALLPVFVLADRLTRFIGMALSPLYRVLQGWVPAVKGLELLRRISIGGQLTAVASGLGGIIFAVGLPLFGSLLTHNQVLFDPGTAIAFGIIAAIQIGSPYLTGVALMAVGRLTVVSWSLLAGVPLSLAAILVAEMLGVEEYAVWAFVASTLAVLVWQILALRTAMSAPAMLESEASDEPALAGTAS